MSHPSSITGGCLCGSIRYTISFPNASDWPPQSGTCQCTQCRKATGALIPQLLSVPNANLTPALNNTNFPTYTLFQSSAAARRGFCAKCGASLTWVGDEMPESTEIHIGSLDEEVLVGERSERQPGEEDKDEYGEKIVRRGGWGGEVARPAKHIFVENAVPGVSDLLPGTKYLTNQGDGEGWEGTLKDVGRA